MAYCASRSIKATVKPRICNWCDEAIPIGSSAIRLSGVDESNDFFSVYTHPECNAAMTTASIEDLQVISPGSCKRGTTEEK